MLCSNLFTTGCLICSDFNTNNSVRAVECVEADVVQAGVRKRGSLYLCTSQNQQCPRSKQVGCDALGSQTQSDLEFGTKCVNESSLSERWPSCVKGRQREEMCRSLTFFCYCYRIRTVAHSLLIVWVIDFGFTRPGVEVIWPVAE